MLAELVNALVGLGRETTAVKFHTHPENPGTVWVQHGDELEAQKSPAPLRAHKLLGYDDLVAALLDPQIAPAPEVYISGNRVAVLLDRAERRSVVNIELLESKRLQLCRGLEAQPRKMQPRDVVKMLRLELHGGRHDHVIQALSRVDFARTGAGRSHVEHGKESLGRSVEAHVQQAEAIPKDFTVGVPLWTNPGFARYAVSIEFGLFLDLDEQVVELRVLSDECQRVVNATIQALASDLREALGDKVPVFLGTP